MRSHLRLLPKPPAKCGEPRAYPKVDGVAVRRSAVEGMWLVEGTKRGRTTTIAVTRAELVELFAASAEALAKEES